MVSVCTACLAGTYSSATGAGHVCCSVSGSAVERKISAWQCRFLGSSLSTSPTQDCALIFAIGGLNGGAELVGF